jgi:hypothetical protein
MANLYGVANPLQIGTQGIVLSLIPCPAGVETTVASVTMAAPSAGFYYPVIWGIMILQIGATKPNPVNLAGRIGAGADFGTCGLDQTVFNPSSNFMWPFMLAGPASDLPWRGAGSTVNLTVNPTGQAVTAYNAGSFFYCFLFRAPDQ